MKTLSNSTGTLAIAALVFFSATTSRADGPNFRPRLPNPAQKIAEKIHKVGDIFLRTARVLEGALPFHGDDDDYYEPEGEYYPPFMEPPPYQPPYQQPYQPQVGPPPRPPHLEYDSRVTPLSRAEYDYLHAQAEQNRLAAKRSGSRLQQSTEPMPRAPSLDEITEPKPKASKSARTPAPTRQPAPSFRQESVPNPVPSYRPLPPSAATPKTESMTLAAPSESNTLLEANPPSTPIPTAPPQKYQYGRSVPNRPGLVYPPGREQIPANMVDVRGISSGTKVRDPSNGSIFLVP